MENTLSGSHNQHARFSPSSAHEWTQCTASKAFQEANKHRIPADTSSAYSNEGTEAHDWAAKVLLNQTPIHQVPEDFRPYVSAYVVHCVATVPTGVGYSVEVEVPLFYQPTKSGTCDFAVITDSLVVIRDLKYGAGVLVSAFENEQLAIYALSLIRLMDVVYDFTPETVVDIGIFQPRHREAQDAVPWKITLAELEKFCEPIEYAFIQASTAVARAIEKLPCGTREFSCSEVLEAAPGVKFLPGEGDGAPCRWCDAKAFCDARRSSMTDGLTIPDRMTGEELISMLPDLNKTEKKLPVAERLELRLGGPVTDQFLVQLYANRKMLSSLLDDAEEYLENRVLSGEQIPGLKIVDGRMGNRAWVNEDSADTFLKGQGMKQDDRYDYKLKSPTKIEEILAEKLKSSTRTANRFAELVSRSAARKTIAVDTDKREAVPATIDLLPEVIDV